MILPAHFIFGFCAWLGLEFAAFIAVVQNIGFSGALLLGLATLLAGFALMRQTGRGAWEHLRSSISGAGSPQGDIVDGLIRALAAILLILPGFVSDLVGLALAAPSVRQILARRFGASWGATASVHRRGRPEIVELAPGEWVSHDPVRR
ncbi:FxsA family protein [Rhodoblastus sp.]|uniref:FxsA family protein n=1 Tax=Rhodoblastus sp. TaxID=1962975 RepID=UPI003F969999